MKKLKAGKVQWKLFTQRPHKRKTDRITQREESAAANAAAISAAANAAAEREIEDEKRRKWDILKKAKTRRHYAYTFLRDDKSVPLPPSVTDNEDKEFREEYSRVFRESTAPIYDAITAGDLDALREALDRTDNNDYGLYVIANPLDDDDDHILTPEDYAEYLDDRAAVGLINAKMSAIDQASKMRVVSVSGKQPSR